MWEGNDGKERERAGLRRALGEGTTSMNSRLEQELS